VTVVLRFWAPVHGLGRFVTRHVKIDGAVVPAGSQAAILFGAGNRDPRHYGNPDASLVERNPVDHLRGPRPAQPAERPHDE
jgi:cytochrome P450